MSNDIQPPEMIGPMAGNQPQETQPLEPAKEDYKQGREALAKGDYSAAAIAFHNALVGFEQINDQHGIANAADRLGDVCLAKQQYQLALDNYQRAAAICATEEDSFSLVALNKKIAAAQRGLGNHAAALAILFDVIEHYQLTRNPKGTVETMAEIAAVYEAMGERKRAADSYRTIASIHANFNHKQLAEEFARRARHLGQD